MHTQKKINSNGADYNLRCIRFQFSHVHSYRVA